MSGPLCGRMLRVRMPRVRTLVNKLLRIGRRPRAMAHIGGLLLLFALPHQAVAVDGSWQGVGQGLTLSQRGRAVSSAPLRPAVKIPTGAQVTSVGWHITSQRPLPAGSQLAICLPGSCVLADGLSGNTQALAGNPANNPLTLLVKLPGSGALYPPIRLVSYQIWVNYR